MWGGLDYQRNNGGGGTGQRICVCMWEGGGGESQRDGLGCG